jgi:hypothetical protein
LLIKYVSIWKWIQKCKPKKILSKRKLMNISLMKLQSRSVLLNTFGFDRRLL